MTSKQRTWTFAIDGFLTGILILQFFHPTPLYMKFFTGFCVSITAMMLFTAWGLRANIKDQKIVKAQNEASINLNVSYSSLWFKPYDFITTAIEMACYIGLGTWFLLALLLARIWLRYVIATAAAERAASAGLRMEA